MLQVCRWQLIKYTYSETDSLPLNLSILIGLPISSSKSETQNVEIRKIDPFGWNNGVFSLFTGCGLL